jgi:hypothetical protein
MIHHLFKSIFTDFSYVKFDRHLSLFFIIGSSYKLVSLWTSDVYVQIILSDVAQAFY